MLRERNKSYATIKFVDISSDDYSPEENQGLDYETVGFFYSLLYANSHFSCFGPVCVNFLSKRNLRIKLCSFPQPILVPVWIAFWMHQKPSTRRTMTLYSNW